MLLYCKYHCIYSVHFYNMSSCQLYISCLCVVSAINILKNRSFLYGLTQGVLRHWSRCWSYSLLLCGLFYEAICFMACLVLYFFFFFFFPFSIAKLTWLGEEKASLGAFHKFVQFVLVWFCWFSLPLGVWEIKGCGLWLWHSLDFSLPFF